MLLCTFQFSSLLKKTMSVNKFIVNSTLLGYLLSLIKQVKLKIYKCYFVKYLNLKQIVLSMFYKLWQFCTIT